MGDRILVSTLKKTYKRLLQEPLKTFVVKDFGDNYSHTRKHLNCLKDLGLVEIVPVIYVVRGKSIIKTDIKGYRLIPLKRIRLEDYIGRS